MTKQQTLTPFQLFALCAIASMLGIFVNHPYGLSPAYFWLVIVIFAIQAASAALISSAYHRSHCADFQELCCHLLTPPIARIFFAVFGVFLILRASITLSGQTDAVALYLLEDTSSFAVMLVLLLTAFFALLPGTVRMSGVATLFTLLLPIVIAVVLIVGLPGIDWGELRQLYQVSGGEFAPALIPAAITASGTECALFFLGSKNAGQHTGRGVAAAPAVCAVVFIGLMFVTVGTIGLGGLSSESFPLIEASRQISSRSAELTERFDFPLITASLCASILQLAIYTLCASLAFCAVAGSEKTGTAALVLLPAEFAISRLIQFSHSGSVIHSICAIGLVGCIIIVFPILALLSFLRYRTREVKAHE